MSRFLIVAVALLSCSLAFRGYFGGNTFSWHQRLSIVVETPTGEVTGASVSAVSWRKHWIRWDGMGWSYDLTGEGRVIDAALFDEVRDKRDRAAGVRLKSVTLEVVTVGRVEAVLGWLGEYPEIRLFPNVSPTDFSPEAQLDQAVFIRRH